MAFFPWKSEYSVGVAELDAQHMRLVGYLNDLYEAMTSGKGKDALVKVLDGLMLYCKVHFDTEEQLMRESGYPDFEAHREKHLKMTKEVVRLRGSFREGTLTSPIQITNFLKNWLAKHILETDLRYAPHLAKHRPR